MATYTSNYGLHQWAPEDNFLRTDFNEDLKKIDTALGQKASQSQVSSLVSTINGKCRVLTGSYTGDELNLSIYLGLEPKAVFVFSRAYTVGVISGMSGSQLSIASTGFTVSASGPAINVNQPGNQYYYVVLI